MEETPVYCCVCNKEISDLYNGARLTVPENAKRIPSYRKIHMLDFNWGEKDDPKFACSEGCREKAMLNGEIPFRKMMAGIVPPRFLGEPFAQLKNWKDTEHHKKYESATKWLEEAPNFTTGWIFSGSVGRGKTCLAAALAYELRNRGLSVKWVDCYELAKQIDTLEIARKRESYTFDKDITLFEQEFFNDHGINSSWDKAVGNSTAKYDVFIFDDITYVKFNSTAFMDLLNRLYNENVIIIVTSNLHPEQWLSMGMEPRVVSRFKAMCKLMFFKGDDYRSA